MRFESSFHILLVTWATFSAIHFSKLHTLQCLHPGVSVTAVTTNCTDEILDWRCPYRGTNSMEQQAPDELRTHRVPRGVVSEWHTALYKVQRSDGRQQVAPKLLYVFNRQHGETSDTTIIFHSSFTFITKTRHQCCPIELVTVPKLITNCLSMMEHEDT